MKHEIHGLCIEVTFNKMQFREALIKKIAQEGEIHHRALRQWLIDELVAARFLKAELGSALLDLDRDEIIDGDLKPVVLPTKTEKGVAIRHYWIRGSNQTARETR